MGDVSLYGSQVGGRAVLHKGDYFRFIHSGYNPPFLVIFEKF
jgi:hypothetical protein